MEKDAMREVLALYLEERIELEAAGSGRKFARMTGIAQPDISNAVNKKRGKYVTWEMLTRISKSLGPTMPEMLADLANRTSAYINAGIASGERPLVQRERLQPQLVSGEIRARAAAVRARLRGARPQPQSPPEIADEETTDDR